MTRCEATSGDLACCRANSTIVIGGREVTWRPQPMPHLDPSGLQWDERGVRRPAGNNPWKEKT